MTEPAEDEKVEGADGGARLSLPRPPETPPRHPFPVLASLAPLVGSVAIWAITSSPFALVFAFLGPVIAVASMADARLQAARLTRRELARFRRERSGTLASIAAAHEREAAGLSRSAPGAIAILDAPVRDPERWRAEPGAPVPISLGIGRRRSSLRFDGEATEAEGLRELIEAGATVLAPVVVDARLGIGVCGPEILVRAVVRGLALQVANGLPPERGEWSADADESGWLASLPHVRATGRTESAIVWEEGSGLLTIAFAEHPAGLPHGCRVVVAIGVDGAARILSHPRPELLVRIEPEFVSIAQAGEAARRLARAADGRDGPSRVLPGTVSLTELSSERAAGGLGAVFLVGADGPMPLDLVGDGPHAVVAGTTGSGKSELLLSWLLAIAERVGPDTVNFLLVDFKGGAAFAPLAGLPHVVGLVTDLDERSAQRALSSLRAEVRLRERVIADSGRRSIDELPADAGLPRLVIVVDEFAALVGGFGELHELFADLAARGRSLGIHLVLCTQRPAGVVRDSVLANVPLRLSLRVNNRADSAAVIGTDAAAGLPAEPAGRAVLAIAGAEPVAVQVAMASASDVERATERWSGAARPRRPWCDDLPLSLILEAVPASEEGFAFGLSDLPDQQRQAAAAWVPATDGNLLVLGAAGSGKSTMLSVLRRIAAATPVAPDAEVAWDAVSGAVEAIRSGDARPAVMLVDDVDALLTRFGDDHQQAFVGLLVELLRTGGAGGVHLVLAARRLPAQLQSIAASCDCRLILRQQNRQEHLIAGGDPALFAVDAPAGRGEWRGGAVQVALADAVERPAGRRPPPFDPTRWAVTLVVSGRPHDLAGRLAGQCDVVRLRLQPQGTDLGIRSAHLPTVMVGDTEAWHAGWAQLTAMRPTAAMLFDRCTVADFRALSGQRRLPPPIAAYTDDAWLLEPDGVLSRVSLPGPVSPAPLSPAPPRAG